MASVVADDENYFTQMMINLLRMAMGTIVNKGYIKMYTSMAMRGSMPNLIFEFLLSSCKLDAARAQSRAQSGSALVLDTSAYSSMMEKSSSSLC